MVKAVILDMDGTIIDSLQAHIKSYEIVFKPEELKLDKQKLSKLWGMTDEDIMMELHPQLSSKKIKELSVKKRKAFIDNVGLVRSFPKTNEVIRWLAKNYVIGLASGAHPSEIRAVIKKFGWGQYLRCALSSFQVRNPKPGPDVLLKASEVMSVKVNECVYVGDTIIDGLTARNAGMEFIAVLTGQHSREDFQDRGFNRIALSLPKIKEML